MTGPTPEPAKTIKCPGCAAEIDVATGRATFAGKPGDPAPSSPAGQSLEAAIARIEELEKHIKDAKLTPAPKQSAAVKHLRNRYFWGGK